MIPGFTLCEYYFSRFFFLQVLPKHFHLGTVVESPVDFYSSRIPKKSRKRTLAEEILSNEESLRYAF